MENIKKRRDIQQEIVQEKRSVQTGMTSEKTKYRLAELLPGSDKNFALSCEDRQWLEASPVGNEII